MERYQLTLYVTGDTPRSRRAISNIEQICEEEISSYELNIIDIQEHPQLAEDEKIWATPTLIKELPEPLQRVIGDFSKKSNVLLGLSIREDEPPETS